MRLRLSDESWAEIDEAAAFLESQRSGLGRQLVESFWDAANDILGYPEANPYLIDGWIRRKRLARFQYGIVYRVVGDEVRVIAFMHLHRRPGYWADRVE